MMSHEISRERRAGLREIATTVRGNTQREREEGDTPVRIKRRELRTLLDYADERDEAVALLNDALAFVQDPNVSSITSYKFIGTREDMASAIRALIRRVGGNHD